MSDYLALWTFVVFMVSTPGPANMLLMGSGAQHGFIKCVNFMLGLASGKILLNIAIPLGLGLVIGKYPLGTTIFVYVSAGYMSWLALKGWNNHKKLPSELNPLTYIHGTLVHPMSPKAWVMSLLAYSQFGPEFNGFFEERMLIPASFLIGQLVFHSLWCFSGVILKTTIGSNGLLNRCLIIITILVVLWALFYGFSMG